MVITYISTGSNVGDRFAAISRAREALNSKAGIVTMHSSVYETEPWGFNSETSFLNQVLILQTSLSPARLMNTILDLEKEMGRRRSHLRYEPRVIDIDILLYGKDVYNTHHLQIPHPRMNQRKFVLIPLAEIAPDLVHPVLKLKISEILQNVEDNNSVSLWKSAADISLEISGRSKTDI
ncbi:MAG TPA: 2-amino-4-hydroxy-6-hydroxymethyldihydropteridine diphosphokinase [Bacteroidales bacterium]|nr:2-amino-4-hydroxy-6-hydroxymethyldihydropteridine diphosphokinase [Bacteroidales bacterium]